MARVQEERMAVLFGEKLLAWGLLTVVSLQKFPVRFPDFDFDDFYIWVI